MENDLAQCDAALTKGCRPAARTKAGHTERHSQWNNVLAASQLSEPRHWPSSKDKNLVLSARIPFQ